MAYRRNARQSWTRDDVRKLRTLARQNTPLVVIAMKLGRTMPAVRRKASCAGVSLALTNQSPYGNRHG